MCFLNVFYVGIKNKQDLEQLLSIISSLPTPNQSTTRAKIKSLCVLTAAHNCYIPRMTGKARAIPLDKPTNSHKTGLETVYPSITQCKTV
jgi:hypothetical protein